MHALAGLLLTVLAFVLAELARTSLPFSGLFNPAALTLLIFGPIAVSLISHPFADWVGHLRVLLRAFRHRRAEALSMAAEEMSEIGRAVRESRWDEAVWSGPIPELLVLDETPLGSGVLSGDRDADVFERVLRIVSNGSFPGPGSRDRLTAPQRRQLRDAMTFEAHCRQRRHLFVSDDKRAFINHGRREALQSLGRTRILTSDEFIALAMSGFADA